MIQAGEPDGNDLAIQRARHRLDTAYRDLMAAIGDGLKAGKGPSRISRYAGYSREHIAKIRDRGVFPLAPRKVPPRRPPGA